MEKIIVELNRKEVEIELASPTYGEMQEIRKFRTGKLTELTHLQKKLEKTPDSITQEEVDRIFELLEEKEQKNNEIILKCCTNEKIKTTDDFKNMSSDGVIKLHKWLEEKTGLSGEGKKENFTKT